MSLVIKEGKKEDPRNDKPVSLTSFPGKLMEQIILEIISKHINDKKVTGNSEYGFMKGRSCLADLIASYGVMTGPVDEVRTADVYLDFS